VVTVTPVGLFAAYKPEWGEVGARAIREGIAEPAEADQMGSGRVGVSRKAVGTVTAAA
jgi:hypothetical protein